MTPSTAYRRFNKLLWLNRLPKATIVLLDKATMPRMYGLTLHDGKKIFMKPIVLLNRGTPWGRTLIHEMLHVAEPELPHGPVFDKIVRLYWRVALENIPHLLAETTYHQEKPRVS